MEVVVDHMETSFFLEEYFARFQKHLSSCDLMQFDLACEVIADTGCRDNSLLIVGNGGSASVAAHFALDCVNALGFRARTFNQAELVTCLANDYGYEHWVRKALERFADERDLLVLISSSGESPNMLNAASAARQIGLGLLTLTGFHSDNALRQLGDVNLWVDSNCYNTVEMVHQIWLLAMIDKLAALGVMRQ